MCTNFLHWDKTLLYIIKCKLNAASRLVIFQSITKLIWLSISQMIRTTAYSNLQNLKSIDFLEFWVGRLLCGKPCECFSLKSLIFFIFHFRHLIVEPCKKSEIQISIIRFRKIKNHYAKHTKNIWYEIPCTIL